MNRPVHLLLSLAATLLPLLAILALATSIRLANLSTSTLWTDELFSLQSSAGRGFWVETIPRNQILSPPPNPTALTDAGPVYAIYSTQNTDTNPPLYYMILRLWRELVGSTDVAVRVPSLIASLVTVAAMFGIFRTRSPGQVDSTLFQASAAGLLTTVASTQIIYAHEARGYPLALAFVTLAALAITRIKHHGWSWPRALALGTTATLAISCIYLAALPVLALGVYAALELNGRDRTRTLLTGLAAAGVTTLLLTPLLLQQLPHLSLRNSWLVSEKPRTLGWILSDLATAIVNQIAPLQERSAPTAYIAITLFTLAAIPLWRYAPAARLWLIWIPACLLPLAIMDFSGNKTHLTLLRYTLLCSPGVIGLICSLATLTHPRLPDSTRVLLFLIPLTTIAYATLSLTATADTDRGAKEDWTLVTTFTQPLQTPRTLHVVAAYGQRRWDHILYLGLMRYAAPTPPANILITDDPAANLAPLRDIAATDFDTLIVFTEEGSPPPDIIPPGWTKISAQKFPTVGTLAAFRPVPATSPAP